MTLGKGSATIALTPDDVRNILASADAELFVGDELDPTGKRVLVIIPDGTRTAPIPLLFRLLYERFWRRVAQLDYLIALGTHGRTGLQRWALGSVAERVLRSAEVPLLLVRGS